MIPDALCSVCHRAHPAETLDARARCSSCVRDLGVADTVRPPARSAVPRALDGDAYRGAGAVGPGARPELPRAAARRGCPMSPAAADCTPVVLVELVTDPRDAGLCDCGEREPVEGSDACEVCDGEAVL